MLGTYRLEILTKTGWKVIYEGDDVGAYTKATFKAGFDGETTRSTNIGRSGVRPPEEREAPNVSAAMSLPRFLLARIEEDEARENGKYRIRKDVAFGFTFETTQDWVEVKEVNGWRKERISHPEFTEKYCESAPDERVLAECKAKRAIVADHEETMINGGSWGCKVDSYRPGKCPTLRTLAAVYKDHPDYRQEWAG